MAGQAEVSVSYSTTSSLLLSFSHGLRGCWCPFPHLWRPLSFTMLWRSRREGNSSSCFLKEHDPAGEREKRTKSKCCSSRLDRPKASPYLQYLKDLFLCCCHANSEPLTTCINLRLFSVMIGLHFGALDFICQVLSSVTWYLKILRQLFTIRVHFYHTENQFFNIFFFFQVIYEYVEMFSA